MSIQPFALERFFALYEFKTRYLLSSSDCESLSLSELLGMASHASLELWNNLRLGYTESPGHPLLRAEIARLYAAIPPDNIVVAAPEEAIFVAMHTLLQPGDHVIAVAPMYQSLMEIARSIGYRVTPWTLHPTPAGWQLDLRELESALTPATRLLVLNFPHNPTGHTLTRAELDAVIALARRHNLTIFMDEMYRLLEWDESVRLPPICDLYEKGISLSGLSKTFALPGLRIGWLASQDASLPLRWLTFKDYTTICNSAPSEILGIIALQNWQRIAARSCAIVRGNLATAARFFAEFDSLFQWLPPRAGSVAFPRWLGAQPVEQFCQQLLDSRGVMLVPGSLFGYPGNHFRLGLGRANFPEALNQFRAHIIP